MGGGEGGEKTKKIRAMPKNQEKNSCKAKKFKKTYSCTGGKKNSYATWG